MKSLRHIVLLWSSLALLALACGSYAGFPTATPGPTRTPRPTLVPMGAIGGDLAFASSRDESNMDIYLLHGNDDNVERLTTDAGIDNWPRWSPDGTMLTFMSNRTGNGEIFVMNADGSGQRNLTNHAAWDQHPVWSPDGTRIAFVSNRDGQFELYVMNVTCLGRVTVPVEIPETCNTFPIARLTENEVDEGAPTWSPDSNRIAYHSGLLDEFRIEVIDATCAGIPVATDDTPQAPPAGVVQVEATPTTPAEDEDAVGVESGITSGQPIVEACRTALLPLVGIPELSRFPSWSPDGKLLSFHGDLGSGPASSLVPLYEVIMLDTTCVGTPEGCADDMVVMTGNSRQDGSPTWSPDGSYLAFHSTRAGRIDLYVMSTACVTDVTSFVTIEDANGLIDASNGCAQSVERLSNSGATDQMPDWRP